MARMKFTLAQLGQHSFENRHRPCAAALAIVQDDHRTGSYVRENVGRRDLRKRDMSVVRIDGPERAAVPVSVDGLEHRVIV